MDANEFIDMLENISLVLAVGVLIIIVYFIARKTVKR